MSTGLSKNMKATQTKEMQIRWIHLKSVEDLTKRAKIGWESENKKKNNFIEILRHKTKESIREYLCRGHLKREIEFILIVF